MYTRMLKRPPAAFLLVINKKILFVEFHQTNSVPSTYSPLTFQYSQSFAINRHFCAILIKMISQENAVSTY